MFLIIIHLTLFSIIVVIHIEKLYIFALNFKNRRKRHEKDKVKRNDLKTYKGDVFVGIDAGSTTTKLVLIDENGALLYSLYENNK